MRKLVTTIMAGMLIASAGACFADEVYYVNTTNYKPTLLDKIEDSTQDMAEAIGNATTDAAQKTGNYIKDKSKTAADATGKAVKSGAQKTGEAVKSGAKKAGHATKKGAKKATNWSAKKIRNGAEKVIIKTEEDTPVSETANEE